MVNLLIIWGNFIQRNLAFCNKYFDAVVPSDQNLSELGLNTLKEIEIARNEIATLVEAHKYRDALDRLMALSRKGNEFFSEEEPWKIT